MASTSDEDPYENQRELVDDILDWESWYISLAMDALIIAIAAYFIYIKRW